MGAVRQGPEPRFPGGLEGQWVSIDDLAELELFKSGKRAFKVKLNTNFAPQPGKPEPGIKAAVKREYAPGQVICEAGEYGSTAFVLLEGSATAFVPQRAEPKPVPGRSRGSLARVRDMFRRRTQAPRPPEPGPLQLGEVSRYASIEVEAPPPAATLVPGDFFGIDTCINFYPREATVRAEERCVVVEMLRSVLDTIRDAGGAAARVNEAYEASAIRTQLRLSRLLKDLDEDEIEGLAAAAALLDPDSDQVKNGVLYAEGDPADAVFLVRAGTIKLAQQREGNERILTYLGRGAAFGLENVLPTRRQTPLVLRCVSHPELVAPVEIKGTLTLGRSTACEIALPRDNAAVGRKHCRFEERDGEVSVVDLESANFTLLNGERVQRAAVKSGDRVTIVEYVFEVSREPLEATVVAEPIPRLATATGLDSFEVVRVPVEQLKRVARHNDRFLATVAQVARSLDAAVAQGVGRPEVLRELVDLNLYNSQNTLLIDLERCTRCDECVRACSDAHDGVARFTRDGPRFGKYLVTMACRSCTDPKCMIGCPVGSIRRTDSLEIQIEDWCIGCERCANQCPFGNINMVERPAGPAPKPPEAGKEAAPEAVKLRATVCDLCSGYDGPNCVYACPHDAAIRVNPAEFLSAADTR